jgi:drug/metabolite transporter (DMT)-like permease
MDWFSLALSCAFFTACCDAVSKRIMQENDEWLTGSIILGISTAVLLPTLFFVEIKPFSEELAVLLAVALPLEIYGYYLFLSAIRMAPLSLTVPLLALTPVLTLLTSWVLLGESVQPLGVAGIVLVTVGAYVLNGDLMRLHALAPIKALFTNPGSRRMLVVAMVWAVTSSLGKKGILLYGAIPFALVILSGDLVCFVAVTFVRIRTGSAKRHLGGRIPQLLILGGLLMAAVEITHFLALSMAPVAYMISVKRLSLVFGVVLGRLLFKERNIRYRLLGAGVMVAGVFLIYL